MGFWLKIYICEKVWWTKAVEWIARQGLETWKHRQSAEEEPQDRNNTVQLPGSGGPRSARSGGGPRLTRW